MHVDEDISLSHLVLTGGQRGGRGRGEMVRGRENGGGRGGKSEWEGCGVLEGSGGRYRVQGEAEGGRLGDQGKREKGRYGVRGQGAGEHRVRRDGRRGGRRE